MSDAPVAPANDSIAPAPAPAADPVAPGRRAPGPGSARVSAPMAGAVASAVRLPGFAMLDSAARDSITRLGARHEANAWLSFRMPRTVVDAEWRREHARVAARVAEKRPWIASGGPRASGPVGIVRGPGGAVGFSIAAPLFASGPSRRQRARDSVVHAGNVERLARIFGRARARRDSLAVARHDSTRP